MLPNSDTQRRRTRPRSREKTAEALNNAILQLQSSGAKLTMEAVARLVGVHPTLIPNSYDEIHKKILKLSGRRPKDLESSWREKYHKSEANRKQWHSKARELDLDVNRLASINLTQYEEIRDLRALLSAVQEGKLIGAITPTAATVRPNRRNEELGQEKEPR